MKRKRRKEEETNAESKGRQRAVDFLSTSLWMRYKSTILVSNSVSFSCTVLSSVLALIPSICLSLVSSKYCLPRAAAIQTQREKQHETQRMMRKGGKNQNIQIFPFRLFLLFVLDPYVYCCFLRLNVFCFKKLFVATYFVRSIATKLL